MVLAVILEILRDLRSELSSWLEIRARHARPAAASARSRSSEDEAAVLRAVLGDDDRSLPITPRDRALLDWRRHVIALSPMARSNWSERPRWQRHDTPEMRSAREQRSAGARYKEREIVKLRGPESVQTLAGA